MSVHIQSILENRGASLYRVEPETTAFEALSLMANKGIAAVLVMRDDKLLGIFSGKDYAARIALQARDGRAISVQDVMTSPVVTTDPKRTVQECMKIMIAGRFRHLPIMREGAVVGLLTLSDLVRHQLAHQQFEIDQLIRYVGGRDA